MPVTAELREGTAVTLRSGHHAWSGDEPVPAGGSDTGPSPYELLMGALASCTAITLRLYADHKGIALTGVDVELHFDRIHADDVARSIDAEAGRDDAKGGRIERIQTKVTLYGSFDDAQRERLTQVAGRCPVHKTLRDGLRVEDVVAFA